jgi:trehalose-6-phosphatase
MLINPLYCEKWWDLSTPEQRLEMLVKVGEPLRQKLEETGGVGMNEQLSEFTWNYVHPELQKK